MILLKDTLWHIFWGNSQSDCYKFYFTCGMHAPSLQVNSSSEQAGLILLQFKQNIYQLVIGKILI